MEFIRFEKIFNKSDMTASILFPKKKVFCFSVPLNLQAAFTFLKKIWLHRRFFPLSNVFQQNPSAFASVFFAEKKCFRSSVPLN